MTFEEIKDRLTRLAVRREDEGNYTDNMICLAAVELLTAAEEALNETVNCVDHHLNTGTKEQATHREHTRTMALTVLNFGLKVNQRGEVE